jgi:hypothetical protein
VTGAAALILNLALFIALAANDDSRVESTECEYDEVKCGHFMEFVYDDTWPLVGLLLLIPAAPNRMARRPAGSLMPTALDNGQRSTRKQLAAVVQRVLYALRWSR